MATVKLGWWEFSAADGHTIHQCEIEARNDVDALVMEVHDRGPAVIRLYNVTAFYRFEDGQRRIPLYDDEGFRGLDDAQEALTQWYLENAPTLLVTLAG